MEKVHARKKRERTMTEAQSNPPSPTQKGSRRQEKASLKSPQTPAGEDSSTSTDTEEALRKLLEHRWARKMEKRKEKEAAQKAAEARRRSSQRSSHWKEAPAEEKKSGGRAIKDSDKRSQGKSTMLRKDDGNTTERDMEHSDSNKHPGHMTPETKRKSEVTPRSQTVTKKTSDARG